MRTFWLTLALSGILLIFNLNADAQGTETALQDSVKLAQVDELLSRYLDALEYEDVEDKVQEVDYIIDAVPEGELRQIVALRLYDYFFNSKLMGDEAVAIHIFDEWFATEKLQMNSDIDKMNAAIYADFNRSSLLGMQAPRLLLKAGDGSDFEVPGKGRSSVLYFYDTDCSKCKMETILLDYLFKDDPDISLDFYAVYVGTDSEAWRSYKTEHFNFSSDLIRIFHLWDPELQSDFQKQYGVLQTPRMYLVSAKGEIIGRGLDAEALKKLLGYAQVVQELYDRCPLGEMVPDLTLPGVLQTRGKAKELTVSLRKLRGKKTYVMLYSSACTNCEMELKAASEKLSKRDRLFLVNLYELSREDSPLEEQLLNTFDLTELPFIFSLDRKGIVTDKYISFQ